MGWGYMPVAMLGWFVAGICIAAFIILWFKTSYRELSAKRKTLYAIDEQVQMHQTLYMQEKGSEHELVAQNILENKQMVYREVEKDYNRLIKRPINCIPAYIMGFRPIKKDRK